jgi:hypothetical protein
MNRHGQHVRLFALLVIVPVPRPREYAMFRSIIAQTRPALVGVVLPLSIAAATINVTTTANEYVTGAQCSLLPLTRGACP